MNTVVHTTNHAMLIALGIYILLQLGISYWVSRRIHNETDYVVAGRNLGVFLAGVSLFATWFGAETVIGSAAAVADEGLAGARADPFGYTICLLLLAFLLAAKLRSLGLVTIADFFRTRYGRTAEWVSTVIYIPTSIVWAAAQLMALGMIIGSVTPMEKETAMAVATLLIIIYTSMGGLMGDVITDLVQGFVVVIGLGILLFAIFAHFGGIGPSLALIEPKQLHFVAEGESLLARLDTWMIPILGSLVTQEALSRVFGTHTPNTARNACFLGAALYCVIGVIPVLIGLLGTHMEFPIEHRDQFLPSLAEHLLNPVTYIILTGALVSAILSTVNSTLLSIGSMIAHNIVSREIHPKTQAKKLQLTRLTVFVCGLVAFGIAMMGETIYELLEIASSFGSAGIIVIMLFGLWTKRGGEKTAISTLLAGVVSIFVAGNLLDLEAPFLTSLLIAVLTFLTVSQYEKSALHKA